MSDMQGIKNIRAVDWLRAALYGILLFFIYRSTLTYLFDKWQRDDFTYCWIIPFIVLYLVWEKREQLAALPSLPSWKGFIPIGLGICSSSSGNWRPNTPRSILSFWLVVVGLCWLHLGWRKLRRSSPSPCSSAWPCSSPPMPSMARLPSG